MVTLCVEVLFDCAGSKVSTSAFWEMMMSASRASAWPWTRARLRATTRKASRRRPLIMTVSFPFSRVPEASRVERLERKRRIGLGDGGRDQARAHRTHPDAAAVVAGGEHEPVDAGSGTQEGESIRRVGAEPRPRPPHAEPSNGRGDSARA